MFSRLKQGFNCLFLRYDEQNNEEIKKILSKDEFKVFSEMSDYDRLHSYNIYSRVKENKVLFNKLEYLKLALLHDCGKGDISFFRRAKKVLIGDKELENHPERSFDKLKDINLELAILCRNHHNKNVDENMRIFQQIDDE